MLRKAIVKEKISHGAYLVEDIFDQKKLNIRLSGKQRMNHLGFEIGEIIYISCSPYEPDRCRWMSPTYFKMADNQSIYTEKLRLDKLHEDMK